MRLSDFKERCKAFFRRSDYVHEENKWHAKQLVYCRHRVLNEQYDDIADKDIVLLGQLVHLAIDIVMNYDSKVYSKKIGDYVVVGTPDIVFGGHPIEVKFTSYLPKEPREHDMLQLKIYMWLLGVEKGYLWYFSPRGWRDFVVGKPLTDDEVLELIENPKMPRYEWECRFCSLYPCEHKLNDEFEEVDI